MPFDAILGQQLPLRQLHNALVSGHISHAYLFAGIEGIGKWTTAVSFAKALNCQAQGNDFCDACLSCRKIEKQIHPDLFFIAPEKNVIKIEHIRDIQKKIVFNPMEAKRKVVIIDQAEKLNLYAANCLLKTLEEPPDDTVVILVANTSMRVLPTIVSRCQRIYFTPLADTEICRFLAGRGIDRERAQLIAPLAQGSFKRALFLVETDFLARRTELVRLFTTHSENRCETLLHMAKAANEDPGQISPVLEFLQTWYRDLYMLMHGFPAEKLCNRDALPEMLEALQYETRDSILKKVKKLQWIHKHAVFNINYTMALESLLMQAV